MFSVLVCATESALTTFSGTEFAVMQAVTACHKYASDEKGGGGRSTQRNYMCSVSWPGGRLMDFSLMLFSCDLMSVA